MTPRSVRCWDRQAGVQRALWRMWCTYSALYLALAGR